MALPANADQRAALRALLNELLACKPRGWSVVMSKGSLALRPPDRARGKFSIQLSREGFWIAFFDPALNHWADSTYVRRGPAAAQALMSWARGRCPEPDAPARGGDDRPKDVDG